jgi:hypothetical protein
VFKGSTGDPATLAGQVTKLKHRFGLSHVAVVGDRGMLTKARIRDDLKPAELDWVTALRGPAIKALVADGAIQPTLFDERDMAEITHPDYPGERLIACYNPFLEADRARQRAELLDATEAELEKAPPSSPARGIRRVTARCVMAGVLSFARFHDRDKSGEPDEIAVKPRFHGCSVDQHTDLPHRAR